MTQFYAARSGLAGVFAGVFGGVLLALVAIVAAPTTAEAKSAAKIQSESNFTRNEMFRRFPVTERYYNDAVAVLILPDVTKASFVLGGAYGEGMMVKAGKIHSYWSYAAASFGFQAGAQETSQVLFFMTDRALRNFLQNEGLEFGADAEVTVIDKGAEVAIDTTKDTKPVIVIVFGRGGLHGGASLQGGKYTRIYR